MIINEDFFDEHDIESVDTAISIKDDDGVVDDTGNWALEIKFYVSGDTTPKNITEFHRTKGKFIIKKLVDKFTQFLDRHNAVFKTYGCVIVYGEQDVRVDDMLYKSVTPYFTSVKSISLVMLFDMDFESMPIKQKVKFIYDFVKEFYIDSNVMEHYRIDINQYLNWYHKQISVVDYFHIPGKISSLYCDYFSIYNAHRRMRTLESILHIVDKFSYHNEDKVANADILVKYMFKKEYGNVYNEYIKSLSSTGMFSAKMIEHIDNDGQNIDNLISDLKVQYFYTYRIDTIIDNFTRENTFSSKTNTIRKTIKDMKPGVALIKYSSSANIMLIVLFDGVPCYDASLVAMKLPNISGSKLYNEYGRNKNAFIRALNRDISKINTDVETYAHAFYALYGDDEEIAYQKLMEFIEL